MGNKSLGVKWKTQCQFNKYLHYFLLVTSLDFSTSVTCHRSRYDSDLSPLEIFYPTTLKTLKLLLSLPTLIQKWLCPFLFLTQICMFDAPVWMTEKGKYRGDELMVHKAALALSHPAQLLGSRMPLNESLK